MIEIKEKGKGFEKQCLKASENITKLFNKNPKLPRHKEIEKEISKMLEGRR